MAGPLLLPPSAVDAKQHAGRLDNLRSAAAVLEERTRSDGFPDLQQLCRARLSAQQCGRLTSDPEPPSTFAVLSNEDFLSLPDALFKQYDSVQSRSFMGLFPEINRAWISIDNRLFLWNYRDSGPRSIDVYDDQEQIIISAAIVKPLPGVFMNGVEYVLVIATPLEIIFNELAFEKGPNRDGGPRGPLSIRRRTDMSIPTDEINMTQIVTTDSGRIFTRGNDHQIYEIVYQPQESWFAGKVNKINRTATLDMHSILPSFLFGQRQRAAKFIAVDDALQMLYAVTPENNIAMYSIADKNTFTLCAKTKDVISLTHQFAGHVAQGDINEREFEIIALCPVSRVESKHIHLVAITATGMRLYFSSGQHYNEYGMLSGGAKYALELVYVRGPSSFSQSLSQYSSIGAARIHEAVYAQGLMVAAQSYADEVDRIIGVSLDVGRVTKLLSAPLPHQQQSQQQHQQLHSQHLLAESCGFVDIDGKTWAICEMPSDYTRRCKEASMIKPNASSEAMPTLPPGALLNELSTQFEFSPRRFLLLTNMGLTTVRKLRPIDILVDLITRNVNQSPKFFQPFFEYFGYDQGCAMCLGIATGHPSSKFVMTSNMSMTQSTAMDMTLGSSITLMAANLYFTTGTEPVRDYQASANSSSMSAIGGGMGQLAVPVGALQVKHSSKYNGFALYIGRLLRPIWKSRLMRQQKPQKSAGVDNVATGSRWEIAIKMDDLVTVQSNLRALDAFCNEYPRLAAPPTPDTIPTGIDVAAWRFEQEAFAHMHDLLRQSIETISFLSLLVDYNLPEIIASASSQTNDKANSRLTLSEQKDLMDVTFEDFVTTPRGRDIGKRLMTLLINRQIDRQGTVDAVLDMLRQSCPSIFQSSDAVFYKAMELIQSVASRQVGVPEERQQVMDESLRLLKSVVKQLPFDKLRLVVDRFKDVGFFVGVVDLVLAFAAEQDLTSVGGSGDSSAVGNGVNAAASTSFVDGNAYMTEAQTLSEDVRRLRTQSYMLIFHMLENMDYLMNAYAMWLAGLSGSGSPSKSSAGMMASMPMVTPDVVEATKMQVLARATSSRDQLFHKTLYDWMIATGRNTQLLELKTPYLEEYLLSMSKGDDQGIVDVQNNQGVTDPIVYSDLLWQYYVRRGRFIQAAKELYEISQQPYIKLPMRIEYLTKALTNAKSAASSGVVDTNSNDMMVDGDMSGGVLNEYGSPIQETLTQISDDLDVARIQYDIYQRLESVPGKEQSREELLTMNFALSDLFYKYAQLAPMYDLVLAIIYTSNEPASSMWTTVEAQWTAIFQETKHAATSSGLGGMGRGNRSPFEAIADRVKELGRRFYPNTCVFPVKFIVGKMEQETLEYISQTSRGGASSGVYTPDRGWVITTLHDGVKVPYAVLFHAYHDLFESKMPPWTTTSTIAFLLRAVVTLMTRWLDRVQAMSISSMERDEFPVRAVDEAISKYLVMMAQVPEERPLVSTLQHLQMRLRRSF